MLAQSAAIGGEHQAIRWLDLEGAREPHHPHRTPPPAICDRLAATDRWKPPPATLTTQEEMRLGAAAEATVCRRGLMWDVAPTHEDFDGGEVASVPATSRSSLCTRNELPIADDRAECRPEPATRLAGCRARIACANLATVHRIRTVARWLGTSDVGRVLTWPTDPSPNVPGRHDSAAGMDWP